MPIGERLFPMERESNEVPVLTNVPETPSLLEDLIQQKKLNQLSGISKEDLKAGILKVLPIIKLAVRLTPNPFDDLVVIFLEAWATDPKAVMALLEMNSI